MIKKVLLSLLMGSALLAQAQSNGTINFQYDQTPTVTLNGTQLVNPWVGGLNALQYSTLRLNTDAQDDLVVFDRTTHKVSTFVADPSAVGSHWRYAPEYEMAFPADLYGWLLLVDYDGDGRKDVFTSGNGNVRVLHNESQIGQLVFTIAVDPLMTLGFSVPYPIQLYVSVLDIPAITDYDGDGDVDIITFDADGNVLAYQQNMSMEQTGQPGLVYQRTGDICWGHFRKEFCNDFTFGLQCGNGSGSGRQLSTPQPVAKDALAKPLHTGNTLTVVDTDGDGRKDLLFGFVSCENIARLRNAGPNTDQANYVSYDSLFPQADPILFAAFPATYWEDVDGDGTKDLLASPNVSANDNYAFNFRQSSWFYKNTGTTQKPILALVQKDFLQREMVDLGERTAPALADLDGDGDLDLLIGYGGAGLGSQYRAGLWQFDNQGSREKPAFVLITTDYLGLAGSPALTNTVPSFVDVNGDGRLDLILVGTGANSLEIRVMLNESPAGSPASYRPSQALRWPTPDLVTGQDLLTVTDVDGDKIPDLLVGRYQLGSILYYRNAGTGVLPNFQLQNQTFGGFAADYFSPVRTRSLTVADINQDQVNELLVVTDNGRVAVYAFPKPPYAALTLLDSLPTLGYPGSGLVATAGDLNGDSLPDLLLGGAGGGVRYLRNTSQKAASVPIGSDSPWVYPNPTEDYLTVRTQADGQLELLSLLGQILLPARPVQAQQDVLLSVKNLPAGVYLVRLTTADHQPLTRKVLIRR